ncbi:MAG: hypothetical protein CL868_09855, partial [Cytophagaceae bacterium]|nr:hypothetical protein [Cytophagaceae bacterium]
QTPTLTGTADSVDDLTVTVNGITYIEGDGNLTDNGDDTWSLTIPVADTLPEGIYDVMAQATDAAGNTAMDITVDELNIDLTPPTVPTVIAQTTSDDTPIIMGTADSEDDITVQVDGVTYIEGDGDLVDNGNDTWTLTIPTGNELSEGVYDVVAEATDAAGNTAMDATVDELEIDFSAPTTPTVDFLTTNSTTPTLTGTLNSDDDLSVTVNGVTYNEGDGILVDNGNGTWTLPIPAGDALPEGVYDVVAQVTDTALNVSTDATIDELTIDLTPPSVPSVDLLTTNNQTPTITGTAASVDDLTVTVNGVEYTEGDGNLVDNGNDTWSLTIPAGNALPEGIYDVQAEVTDAAGNTSIDGTTDELNIDLTLPAEPTIDLVTTTDTTPVITGTADSVDDLAVTVNGVTYTEGDGNLVDNGDDTWTLNIPDADELEDGIYDVVAEATDVAGNTAGDTTVDELTLSPVTPTGDPEQEFCESDSPTVADILTDQTNVNVYLTETGGTPLSSTDILMDNTSYYVATVGTTIESVERFEVLVTFATAPAPTTTNTTQEFCALDNATVSDIQVNESNIVWYDAATGGNVVPDDALLEDGNIYYAAQVTGTCESATRLAITTVVNEQPEISLDGPASVSVGLNQAVALPGVTTVPAGLTVTWYDNSGAVFTGSSVSFSAPGLYVFTASAENSSGCSNSTFFSIAVYDQDDCPPALQRTYATSSQWNTLGGTITNAGNGNDGNPKTSATITTVVGLVGLGGGYYDLDFDQQYAAGTAVSVKMGKEYSGLGAISGFLVYGLDASGNTIGSGNSANAGLINLLSADSAFEFTFVPNDNTGPKAFSGVRVYFGSLLSVADSYDVYDAYVTEQATTLSCSAIDATTKADVQDVFYGVDVELGLDALSATASVVGPWASVDKDLTTFTTLSRGAEVLNSANLEINFKSKSQPTDSLQIIFSRPDNGLLQLGLLNGFEIQLYNGDAAVGAPITNTSEGLNLQLLGLLGGAGESAAINVPTPDAYDRVVISYGGVANVLDAIQISDVDRKAAVVPATPLNVDGELELCSANDPIVLSAQDDCTWFEIYDESDDLLTTTDNYEFELPSGLTEGQRYNFTVQPVRQGCDFGPRQDLVIYVKESAPDTAITSFTLNGASDVAICETSADVTLSVTVDGSLTLTNPVYYWYEDQSGTQVLVDGETDATLNLGVLPAGDYTYYVGLSSDEYCITDEADRYAINFTINPGGMPDDVTVTGNAICFGDTATITPSSTYGNVTFTWYYTNDLTAPITDGDTSGAISYAIDASGNLMVSGLTLADDGITYYVSIMGGDGNVCENEPGNLTPVSVLVSNGASTPTTANANQEFCVIDAPTVADLQVNEGNVVWFDAPSGGNAYQSTDLLVDGMPYYGAQIIGSCESGSRVIVTAILNDTAAPTTSDTTQEFCTLDNATLADVQINETNIIWYDAAMGGNVLADDTLVADGGVYYAAQGGTGCESSTRLAVTTIINSQPIINFTGPSSVNTGLNQTVTLPGVTTDPAGLTVTWYDNNGAIFTGSSISFATPGVYVFTASAENSSGCSNSAFFTITVFDQDDCPPAMQRVYATGSNWTSRGGFISDASNGVDGNPKTSATVTTVVGLAGLGGGYYDLTFDEQHAAGTPVSVKIGKEYSGLGAVSGFLVYGLDASGNPIGSGNSANAGLLNLLSADSAFEFTFVPNDTNGPQAYTGVRIYFGSLLSVADSFKIYEAYVSNQSATLDCSGIDSTVRADVQDVYYGVETLAGLDALSATASVVDPWLAVDFDDFTYTTLVRGVEVLNSAQLQVEFKTQSQPTDSLRIVLSRVDNDQLQLGLLNGLEIQLYLGDTEVGAPITNTSEGLNLQLLSLLGGTGGENLLTVPTPEAYDKVVISYGGVANVLDALRVHDVDRKAAVETVVPLNIDGALELCYDDTILLMQQDDCTFYQVFDESNNLLTNVDNYEFELPTNLVEGQTYTFTVQPIRQGCAFGPRQELEIYVRPTTPADVIVSIDINDDTETEFCETDNTSIGLTAKTDGTTLTNPTYYWYELVGGNQEYVMGETDATLDLGILPAGTYTYYVGVESDEFCLTKEADRTSVTFTINEGATGDDLAAITVNGVDPIDPLCLLPGEDVVLSTMLSPTSTITNPVFVWYDEAGNMVAGGENGTLNLGSIPAGTYMYSVGVSGDGICESIASERKTVTFTINTTATEDDIADITVNGFDPSNPLCIEPTEDVILMAGISAASTIANPVFAWYDEAGNMVAGGEDGNLNLGTLAPGTYTYSVGVSGDGYCENLEADRKAVTFTINEIATEDDIADITLNGEVPTGVVCIDGNTDVVLGTMLSSTSTITNPVFAWYDEAGNMVAGGEDGNLNLGVLVPGTYTYSVGVSGDGHCENLAADRKEITFTINHLATEDDIADVLVNGVDPTDPFCLQPGDDVILSTMLSPTSTIANPVFAWYDEAGNMVAGGEDGNLNLGTLAPGTYTYSVGVSGDGYCENLAADRKTVTFKINETATADDIAAITVNGFDPTDPLCIDPSEDVILSTMLSPTSTIANPVFAWYDEAGNMVAGGEDGNLNLGTLAPGTYTYSVGVSGDGYCENLTADRKTVTFTINETATADDIAAITVNGFDPTDPLCIDPSEDVILSAMLSPTSTIANPVFAWYDEAGNMVAGGEDGNLNLGVLAPGTYTYSVGVSGDGYCENLATDRKTVTFTINETATADDIAAITVNGFDPTDPLCLAPDEDVMLMAMLSPASTITNPVFAWYDEAGNMVAGGEDGNLNLGVLAPGTYTYSVGVSGDGYCENLAADRETVTFTINRNPTAADVMVTGAMVCYPDNAVITPTSTVANPSFSWYMTNDYTTQIIDGDTDGAITYAIAADGTLTISGLEADVTYTYYVSVTNGDTGCSNTAGDLAEVEVYANPGPDVQITLDQDITADDIINIAESSMMIPITGTVGGDVEAGDEVEITVNGVTYTATVAIGLTFSIDVNGSDLVADADLVIEASVTIAGEAPLACENTATATAEYTVDVTAPTIPTVDFLTTTDTTPTLTGTAESDDMLSVTVNGVTYTEGDGNLFDNGDDTWTLNIPDEDEMEDGTYDVVAEATDTAGNVSVDVTIDELTITVGAPVGDEEQQFCATDNPVVADIETDQDNVNVYLTETGGTPLSPNELLSNDTDYYVATVGINSESMVRLKVHVIIITVPVPTASETVQEFCESENPTIADIEVNEINVVWYSDLIGGTIVGPGEPLVNNTTYYGSLRQDGCESKDRLGVTVIVKNDDTATLKQSTPRACFGTEITYTTESGMQDYAWTYTGAQVIDGGGSTDNFITLVWDTTGANSISVMYLDTMNCNPAQEAMLDVDVVACTDLVILKTVDDTTPVIGSDVVYTITVTSEGISPMNDIIVDEMLPSGLDYVSHMADLGDYDEILGTWLIPVLMPGEVATLQITATVVEGNDYLNIAYITSSSPTDEDSGNNESSVEIDPECLKVFNEFSPNDDGKNDTFFVRCIEKYPNNHLEIYNRDGSLIYETDSYKNGWGGTSNQAGFAGSGRIPSGTYYYVLDLRDGSEVLTGWVYIAR